MKLGKMGLIWTLASFLSKPYLHIQVRSSGNPRSIMGRLRLKTAIFLYDIVYKSKGQDGALFFAGKCYQSLEDHSKALEFFKKAWETASFSPVLFKEIGTTCLELKRYDEGLQYALKEVSQFPNDADSHANLALFLCHLGRMQEASEEIQRAKALGKSTQFIVDVERILSKKMTICETCKDLTSRVKILNHHDLSHVIRVVKDSISNGMIVEKKVVSTFNPPSFNDVKVEGPWDFTFDYHFECSRCKKQFRLYCDAERSGGEWSVL